MSHQFAVKSAYKPTGDQPRAIEQLIKGFKQGVKKQALLGVTGSGKTFTAANVLQELGLPTLVIAHNKTLAAQLYSEFKELFPDNAVRYFVSYYDYYQPEAYVPSTDTYIEKDSAINDEIDMLRHGATKALLERKDVIIVASVSCIYGLGDPEKYFEMLLFLEEGETIKKSDLFEKLVKLQFERNDLDFRTGCFRARGDVVEICPASESENAIRLDFFGDELEEITEFDRLTGKDKKRLKRVSIFPASHFVTDDDIIKRAAKTIKQELHQRLRELKQEGKEEELARLESRTLYDLEMLQEMGFCPGIENYSRHFTGRAPGAPPPTLIDYFPEDFLLVVDESHVSLPQVRGMYRGDISRKGTLVNYGFRLPSALDNRPLNYDEFSEKLSKVLYVSATPGPSEREECEGHIVQQLIRPTGVLDPVLDVRKAGNQVEDFLAEIHKVIDRKERVLITTLTKRMSEHLAEYYREVGIKVKYLHSDIHTLDRIELIRALRQGEIDVLIGINLLREGLDLPEVSLVGIMDADKEGFLRSETSLIQTIGRAARNVNGKVILYADRITGSMRKAIDETERRRKVQQQYNEEHGITAQSVKRTAEALSIERYDEQTANNAAERIGVSLEDLPRDAKACKAMIADLRSRMQSHAKKYEFEAAAALRDQVFALEDYLLGL